MANVSPERAGASAKPPLGYRIVEFIGLVLLIYGLASSAWLTALVGALTILATYALYRGNHDVAHSTNSPAASMADDTSGGD
jgi:uncharacterized membrane protein